MTTTPVQTGQPLLRELIAIPEQIHQGDFVLRLTEGVQHIQSTLDSYVITPQLRVAFDEALSLIGSALAEDRSKASYLHGSFGSGKSHFMAVLHALLNGDVDARSRTELADVVARARPAGSTPAASARALPPPGPSASTRRSSAGTSPTSRRSTPARRCPPSTVTTSSSRTHGRSPAAHGARGVHRPAPQQADEGWGDSPDWDDRGAGRGIRRAAGGAERRPRSISDLLAGRSCRLRRLGRQAQPTPTSRSMTGCRRSAAARQELGYDGVVLLLDELVLWLAGYRGSVFVSTGDREGLQARRVVGCARPAPDHQLHRRASATCGTWSAWTAGAESLSFQDSSRTGTAGSPRSRLDDRNLRADRPRAAPASPMTTRPARRSPMRSGAPTTCPAQTWDILLTDGDGRPAFRRTYPFSPAFVQRSSTSPGRCSASGRRSSSCSSSSSTGVTICGWASSCRWATSSTPSPTATTSPSPRSSSSSSSRRAPLPAHAAATAARPARPHRGTGRGARRGSRRRDHGLPGR